MVQKISSIIALDIGEKRIGVAIANTIARLPRPLTTLTNNPDIKKDIGQIIAEENGSVLVVGLPRNLSGDDTAQTAVVRSFVDSLTDINVPICFQDEALTSKKAEQELAQRKKPYSKSDIDALAATYILEDYLRTES